MGYTEKQGEIGGNKVRYAEIEIDREGQRKTWLQTRSEPVIHPDNEI